MKIIDAHLHIFAPSPHTDAMAQAVGHQNSTEHLRQVYGELGMVHGVVMGNRSLEPSCHDYPAGLFHYCIGLDSVLMERGTRPVPDLADKVEENLKRETCCGVKLYPGYNRLWLSDPVYQPIYELAARYGKPVAVHMGLTAFPGAHLKYAHPLALDEVAADHKHTRFVMCHFGNPFLESAAAVVEKNPNVAADLSGLLEGRVDIDSYFQEQAGYASLLTPPSASGTILCTALTGPSSIWRNTSASFSGWCRSDTGRRYFSKMPTEYTAWDCKKLPRNASTFRGSGLFFTRFYLNARQCVIKHQTDYFVSTMPRIFYNFFNSLECPFPYSDGNIAVTIVSPYFDCQYIVLHRTVTSQ